MSYSKVYHEVPSHEPIIHNVNEDCAICEEDWEQIPKNCFKCHQKKGLSMFNKRYVPIWDCCAPANDIKTPTTGITISKIKQYLCGIFTNHFPINSSDGKRAFVYCKYCKREFGNAWIKLPEWKAKD